MGSAENRKRRNWQKKGRKKAGVAETKFFKAFSKAFKKTDFTIIPKPKDFNNIYVDVQLSKKILAEIYNPRREWKHGIQPDYAIFNKKSGKTLRWSQLFGQFLADFKVSFSLCFVTAFYHL